MHLLKNSGKTVVFLFNLLFALFFVSVLTFKKGYSFVPMTSAALGCMLFLFHSFKLNTQWQADKEDKALLLALFAYFFSFVLSILLNGDGIREIDNPSRILLLMPLVFCFRLYPLRTAVLFHAVPLGALVAGLLALYQTFMLKLAKPFPDTMHIQAGNISMALALFSVVITFYWLSRRQQNFTCVYLVFAAFGLIASLLSGARGGWIALPFCFLLILFFNVKLFKKKAAVLLLLLFTVGVAFLLSRPELGFDKRYAQAKSDITAYLEQGNETGSLGARFDMWENALIAITEKPLFGYGSSGYESFKQKQAESGKMAKTTLGFNSLHNQYLESFVKRGVIGFTALLAVLIVPLLIFAKRLKSDDTAIRCLAVLGILHIVSHMFFFLSQSFLAHNSGSLFYFFVLIALYTLLKNEESETARSYRFNL